MALRARLSGCTLFCLAPLLPVGARLARLQILEHRSLAAKANGELSREAVEIVPRGRILDREGRVLAESLPSWSAYIDPGAVTRPSEAAAKLSCALGMSRAEILRKARARGRFAWLKRRITPREAEAVRRLRLDCAGLLPDERRAYPSGPLARSLLGAVGAEGHGLSGLELAYDKALSAPPLRLRVLRDGSGRRLRLEPGPRPALAPDLVLTLDRSVQHYAEAVLAEAVRRHEPSQAAIVVQDPRSGEILALATYPADPLRNHALQEAYEPGSTFKLVALAGVLEEGLARPEDTLDTEGGRWEVAPTVFIKDHEPFASLTLAQVVERSSNIGMAKLGLRLGADRFYHGARAFGFGARTGLPLPGESPGILKPPRQLTRVNLANNAFGQGLAVTSVQLLAAYSAVANGGLLLEPRVVLAVGDKGSGAPAPVRRVASERTVRLLARLLRRVVEAGTGKNAAVPGYTVAGKTGTAQKVDPRTGRYSSSQYISSFVGYTPATDPRFAVLVVLDGPRHQYYGSDVAAPSFAKLVRGLLALRAVPQDGTELLSRGPAPSR